MKFVCPELEGKPSKACIIQSLLEAKEQKINFYDTTQGNYQYFISSFTRKRTTTYYHGNVLMKGYFSSFHPVYTVTTNSAQFTTYGLDLTDYTDLSSYNFLHLIDSPAEHLNGFYWTILTELGTIITYPDINSNSVFRGVLTDSQIISRNTNDLTDYSWENETGYEFTLSLETPFIRPTVIDSTLKNAGLNKYNSSSDIIEFSSGLPIEPLDYVQFGVNTYIIMSRKPGTADGFDVYIAVKQSNSDFGITGSNITLPNLLSGYLTTIFTSQTSVTVTHNFGYYPLIQVMDTSLLEFIPYSITRSSLNAFTIDFSSSTSGTIICMASQTYQVTQNTNSLRITSISYTITQSDYKIKCVTSGITITLPTAVGLTGVEFIVDNGSGGDIYLNTTSSQTINGDPSQTISNNSCINVYSDNANWRIF